MSDGSRVHNDSVGRIEFEAALFRQEHRFFRLIVNFQDRKKYSKDDPRRSSIEAAFFWRLVFAMLPNAAAGSVGIGAIISCILLWQQNSLLRDQHSISSKNDLVDKVVSVASDFHTVINSRDLEKLSDPEEIRSTFDISKLKEMAYLMGVLRGYEDCKTLANHLSQYNNALSGMAQFASAGDQSPIAKTVEGCTLDGLCDVANKSFNEILVAATVVRNPKADPKSSSDDAD